MAVYFNGKQVDVGGNFQLSNIIKADYEYDIGVVVPTPTPGEDANMYDAALSANTTNVLSTVANCSYNLRFPGRKILDGSRKVRDFLIKVYKSQNASLNWSYSDVDGNPITYEYAADSDGWGSIAAAEGDVLIYGCSENEADHMMIAVRALSSQTGTDS